MASPSPVPPVVRAVSVVSARAERIAASSSGLLRGRRRASSSSVVRRLRGAKFVARIADELTFSLERVLQPLQKVVECCSKIPDFVSSQWQWQTGMWVGGADARGADAHAFHGSKSRGGQQIRAQGVDEDVWPCPDRCDRASSWFHNHPIDHG